MNRIYRNIIVQIAALLIAILLTACSSVTDITDKTGGDEYSLSALILNIHNDTVSVEIISVDTIDGDSLLLSGDRIDFSNANLDELDVSVGDIIGILIKGHIWETDPMNAVVSWSIREKFSPDNNETGSQDDISQDVTEERAKEIVFEYLLEIQREISAAGTFLFAEDSSYVFIGDLIGDIEKYDNLPDFEMRLDSISDVEFLSVAFTTDIADDIAGNAWNIDARVNTTWGDIDDLLNFIWSFKIEQTTGEQIGKVWVGANYHRINPAVLDNIYLGMTEPEVRQMLGEPDWQASGRFLYGYDGIGQFEFRGNPKYDSPDYWEMPDYYIVDMIMVDEIMWSIYNMINPVIIQHYEGAFNMPDDGFPTASHELLALDASSERFTAYVISLYQIYIADGEYHASYVSGTQQPLALTFTKNTAGYYELTECWEAENGNRYMPSIQARFPEHTWDRVNALSTQLYYDNLQQNCYESAIYHFFGTAPEIP